MDQRYERIPLQPLTMLSLVKSISISIDGMGFQTGAVVE
jgi:hypothetical protein